MPNLKQKTDDIRRQHILDAAIDVFEEHGFRGATIRQIAQKADVSDGTIYNVFANKEALLLAILRPLLEASSPPGLPPDLQDLGKGDVARLLTTLVSARWSTLTPKTLAMMRIVLSEALINRDLASAYLTQILLPPLDSAATLFEQLGKQNIVKSTNIHQTSHIMVASFMGLAVLKMLGLPALNGDSGDAIASHLGDILARALSEEAAGAISS
jgi:AcrR family transcriptional regulator